MQLRPFPQVTPKGMTKAEFNTKYRKDILSQAGAIVFISGNKFDAGKKTIRDAEGVLEEFRISKELGKYPIPIGMTGHAALTIWKEVTAHLNIYASPRKVRGHFQVLGNAKSTNKKIVEAIFAIVDAANLMAECTHRENTRNGSQGILQLPLQAG